MPAVSDVCSLRSDDGDVTAPQVEKAFEDITGPGGSTNPAKAGPFGQVSSSIAAVMALDTYPIGVDKTRLQRVANVMQQFGLLTSHFDVSSMIIPPSQFDFTPFGSGTSWRRRRHFLTAPADPRPPVPRGADKLGSASMGTRPLP